MKFFRFPEHIDVCSSLNSSEITDFRVNVKYCRVKTLPTKQNFSFLLSLLSPSCPKSGSCRAADMENTSKLGCRERWEIVKLMFFPPCASGNIICSHKETSGYCPLVALMFLGYQIFVADGLTDF